MSSSPLNASLLRLKLLDALRSGATGKLDDLYQQLASTQSTTATTDVVQLRETILHYAVQVAPFSTIQYIVSNPKKFPDVDINGQDSDGNTPLHLAAAASRLDVVKYLLGLPGINDTVANANKKQPVEVAKDVNVAQLMQFERAKFVEASAANLRTYFSNRDFSKLDDLLSKNPRASELLDINGADPETGNTVLHEFIMKDDVQMVSWILKHGGDPFKRDKKGHLPVELTHKGQDPQLKKLIKEASQEQNIMDPVIQGAGPVTRQSAPTYKGYLQKWTNFASGYKLRYFVLDAAGVLSYYATQDDTAANACRGSLNLGYAQLHLDSSEKCKFEIYGKNGIRWHLRANHPVETNRWVWTLQNAITQAKDNLKRRQPSSGSMSPPPAQAGNVLTQPPPISRDSFESDMSQGSTQTTDSRARRLRRKLRIPSRNKHKRQISQASSIEATTFSRQEPSDYYEGMEDFDSDTEGNPEVDDEVAIQQDTFTSEVQSVTRALEVELTSLSSLFTHMAEPEIKDAGTKTVSAISDLIGKYHALVTYRDTRVKKQLERQFEVNRLWENSIQQLEQEIQSRDRKLVEYDGKQKQLKKLFRSKSAVTGGGDDQYTAEANEILQNDSEDEFFDASGFEDDDDGIDSENDTELVAPRPVKVGKDTADNESVPVRSTNRTRAPDEFVNVPDEALVPPVPDSRNESYLSPSAMAQNMRVRDSSGSIGSGRSNANSGYAQSAGTSVDDSSINSFANAQDTVGVAVGSGVAVGVAGTAVGTAAATHENSPVPHSAANSEAPVGDLQSIPEGKRVEETQKSEDPEVDVGKWANESQTQVATTIATEGSYLGYENPPRTKLSMDEDDRPKVGLWGILKSMIGKDMTRMTLPVSFNEPSSLLQRLAEDIECSYLLDTAAGFDDSTLRLLYVATFAVTEYASTIDRIAKPFNPLLGETFEYSRPDQNYRLFTEQVSHHPPISACHADSPKWTYYGENAVDSQFRGRSFDFKHLGKMFCVVRPDNGVKTAGGDTVAEELYSWKKVNTSVVGIMLGNPTVDNYGLMEVRNHTTGDVIQVNMKQRGWSAKSAYQVSGTAMDARGRPQWAMAGHWNSKIFGKKVDGSGKADLTSTEKVVSDPFSGGKWLIWQAAPRPKVPFNLTAFAVTLNNPDTKLVPWVAPSDTRLRPDQRDMEEGRYDAAADEKHRLEEKQRAARRQREESGEEYKPLWFIQKVHPVTGDRYWEYNGKYWKQRKDHHLKGTTDIF